MDETRLRAVLATAVDGIIMIDGAGRVLAFSPACENLFGYQADEVLGQSPFENARTIRLYGRHARPCAGHPRPFLNQGVDGRAKPGHDEQETRSLGHSQTGSQNVKMLMPAPYKGEHDGYLDNYHRTHNAKIIGIGREVVGQRKNGTTFPMYLSVGEGHHEEEDFFVGIVHDLTVTKKTEAQLVQAQKMEGVGQLAGGIAHDFNNLLTVIVGNAEFLSGALKARPDFKELADAIVAAGERGAELAKRLLTFSRSQPLEPREFNCTSLIDEMTPLLRRTLREDIDLRFELAADLWSVYSDPAQLENAILNLSINARDAMPGGGSITTQNITLDTAYQAERPEVPAGDYISITLTDDGEGMSSDVLDHVFEPFFTTKEVGKGTGLGLSMVYGFVKQSNGHITIYSEPGLGTTVRIYLPASSLGAVDDRKPEVDEPKDAMASGSVPLVEDDPFVRSYAVMCLKSLGYEVIAAQDGNEALALLAGHPEIDVLFSDVVMPGGMTGWELVDHALRQRPELKILIASGYSLETVAKRIKAKPDWPVLHKPYRKAELAQRLGDLLGRPSRSIKRD